MNGHETLLGTRRKLRLLVVDDEPHVCECLKLILALDGHEVVMAHSGSAGLKILESHHFDIVCTDYSMPGMRGDQFAAAIKSQTPDQPIVMITGLACTMVKPPAVDYILNKPFVPNDLRVAFDQVLDPVDRNESPSPESTTAGSTVLEPLPTPNP